MPININNLPTKTDIHDADEFLTETIQSEETRNTPYSVIRQDIESNLNTQLNDYVIIHKNNQHKKSFNYSGQTTIGVPKTISIDMSSYNVGQHYSLEVNINMCLVINGVLTNTLALLNTEVFVINNIICYFISNNNECLEHTDFNTSIYTSVIPEYLANSNFFGNTTLTKTYVKHDESINMLYVLPDITISNSITNDFLILTIPTYQNQLDYNIKITKKRFS